MTRRAALLPFLLAWASASGAQAPARDFAAREPDAARDSILAAAQAGLAEGATAVAAREAARRMAGAYASAWGDDFLLRRVDWLLALSLEDRAAYLAADSLRRLGNAQLFRDGPAAARRTWRDAAALYARGGDSVGVAWIDGNVGAAFFEEGMADSAVAYLTRARRRADGAGDFRAAGNAVTILAAIASERGALREAYELSERALQLHEAAGNLGGLAADHNNAALAAEAAGNLEDAERHYQAALTVGRRHGPAIREADYRVNLGGLAARRGDLAAARRAYRDALVQYQTAGEVRNAALVEVNLGTLDASIAAYGSARDHLRTAAELYAAGGDVRGEAEARRLLASVLAAMGRPDDASDEIGRVEFLAAALTVRDPGLEVGMHVVRGDIALAFNRTDEAAGAYDEALRIARGHADQAGIGAAAIGRGLVDARRRRYADVRQRLAAVEATLAPGVDRGWARLLMGVAASALSEGTDARRLLEEAAADFAAVPHPTGWALAEGSLADLEALAGRPQAALARYRTTRARVAGIPSVSWWLWLGTGRVLESLGALDEAAAAYDTAVGLVETLADWVRFDDRRALFLEDKWAPYTALAELRARQGRGADALAASERLRARFLMDRLARRAPPSEAAGPLRARERWLSDRVGELTAALLADDDGGRRDPAMQPDAVLREDLLATQRSYRAVLEQLQEESPSYVRGLRGDLAPPDAIRARLASDELLLEYLVGPEALWIFAVTDTGVAVLPVAIGRAALRVRVDFVRWALEDAPDQGERWRSALRGLDQLLVQPVRNAGLLAGRRTIIIVPHQELHYLPFEALLAGPAESERFLVEDHDVLYAPSAAAWLHLEARARRVPRTGVLALAPLDRELAGTGAEVEAVAGAWGPTAEVHRGRDASETLLRRPGAYHVVHLATRGVLNRENPLFSYVDLRPDRDANGRLEVHEVFRLSLATDLLVLSACRTGLGSGAVQDTPTGDDWVGFVRAFLEAGADRVLATLWAIDDRRTADVAELLHQRLAAGAGYAHALGDAKRAALRDPDLRSPYYWAGFILTGAR